MIQPNEDGSYWRKIVRNKMHRMREQRRVKAAGKWYKEKFGDDSEPAVLSSWGPYTSTVGQVKLPLYPCIYLSISRYRFSPIYLSVCMIHTSHSHLVVGPYTSTVGQVRVYIYLSIYLYVYI